MPTTAHQSQIQELEARIQSLRSSQVNELKDQLREARQTVASLEAEIAAITGKPIIGASPERRQRTRSEDVRKGILKALAETPTGLSQKEISDATGLQYQTVIVFLKKNLKDFKTTGSFKGKRYFLK